MRAQIFKVTTNDGEFYVLAEDMSDAIAEYSNCIDCELITFRCTPAGLKALVDMLK